MMSVPRAVEIAVSEGMHIEFVERKEPSPVNHANTADLTLSDEKRTIRLIGTSVGGGAVEVKYMRWMALRWNYQVRFRFYLEVVSLGKCLFSTIYYRAGVTISKQRVEMTEDSQMMGYELVDLLSPELKEQIQTLRKTHDIYMFA